MISRKNILIIGCYGHIGFSTAIYLSKKYNVVGTYNKTINQSLRKELKLNSIKLYKLDVTDKKSLIRLCRKFKFDTCIYAAAIAHDSIAKKKLQETIYANCLGVVNILNINKKKFKFIYISTGSVFQNIKSPKEKISEFTKPSPASIYSVSKRLGELITVNSFDKNKISTVLRVSWVYGPPIITKKIDVQRGPIPYLMTQLFKLKKKSIYFKSGKDFEASFTYIKDVCFALDRLIKYRKFTNPVFHLGSGKNYKLSEVSKILSKNYKNKNLYMGKGFQPWTSDSVIRGPLISKLKNNKT
jgi:nucleoside-diphosphate-sugar epimerase